MVAAETISAAMVQRVVTLLETRGVPVAPRLARVGLSARLLSAPGARVSYGAANALLELAAADLGPANVGLALALTGSEESYGAAGLLLITAPTFRQGLSRSLAYQRLWGDGERFAVVHRGPHSVVRFRHPGPPRLASAIAAECAMVEVLEGVRALVERDAVPVSVELAHAPLGDFSALSEHLRVTPRFERPHSEIVLPEALVDRPMRAVQELLASALERQARRALSLLPTSGSLSGRIRGLLKGENGLTQTLADAAARLSLSPRTLQRRLQKEDTTFDRLLDDARRERAAQLNEQGTPVKEIAFELGFRDPSALQRAKRRWASR